jgi:uncharacterized protein Yka (UPF0111/DUF47 family)
MEIDRMSAKRHWFLPDDFDLEALLREQGTITIDGMTALSAWAAGDTAKADAVRKCEHRADDKKRELWLALRDSFSPPIDAEDLYSLSAGLDEVLNAAKNLVRESEVMGLAPDPPMREMAELAAGAVGHLVDACAHLGREQGDATTDADAAIKRGRDVEHVYRRAMSALLEQQDLRIVTGRRELYRRMSRIADLVHAVADRVWYAVVKEA